MCGIAGLWSTQQSGAANAPQLVTAMAQAIQHRGPDDAGLWTSEDNSLVVAHQRLSIQDLSPLGHQPMESSSGRYIIVFNGEIYNFKRLHTELQSLGFGFRGHSDTEVMLAAFDAWGIEAALERFSGMFAFAVYDRDEKKLWLVRDRMGEKPLYYGFIGGRLLFCSELKGLLKGVSQKLPLNRLAVGHYFRFGYFPVIETPFQGILKLSPASCLCLGHEELARLADTTDLAKKEFRYWQRPSTHSTHDNMHRSVEQSLDGLEQRLSSAVRDQAIADVKVGVFLSGGIDSTLVAALLQKASDQQINTYTIAFDSKEYNEAPFAKDIATHIGTIHTEIPVSTDECMDVLQKLPWLLDEPFADASLIPSYLVCKAARKHVTVCLSGDGGDELFGGYNRYIQGSRMAQLLAKIPHNVRAPTGRYLGYIPEHVMDSLYWPFAQLMAALGKKPEKDIGAKLHKIARAIATNNERELYVTLLSFWHEAPIADADNFPSLSNCLKNQFVNHEAFANAAMKCDIDGYLVCDNLFKVDRAAMANSLEVRLPLLDRAIVEYAATLPLHLKIHNGQSKWALRQILYRHVPESLMDRPKMGFSVPLADWFRNGMRSWGQAQLTDIDKLRACRLNPVIVQKTWQEHQSGRYDHANALWTIISFLQWQDANEEFIQV